MTEDILEYSPEDKYKMQRKLGFNFLWMALPAVIIILYLNNTTSSERDGGGFMFFILFPGSLELLLIFRQKKILSFLKRNKKRVLTGIITKKEAHLRRGRNNNSHFYIQIDNREEYSFKNETQFNSLQTGMAVRLIFLEDYADFTGLEIIENTEVKKSAPLKTNKESETPLIKTGLTEEEKAIIVNARSKHIKRKLVFIILFGLFEIPGLLMIIVNPETLNLVVVGILLLPYVLYLCFVAHRFNKDLRRQEKICMHSVITDKMESDRLLINNEPEDFSKNNFYYVRCKEGLFNVSKEFFNQCDAGKTIYFETAKYSGTLLYINLK